MNFNTWMEKQALSPAFINKAIQSAAKRGFRKSYSTLERVLKNYNMDPNLVRQMPYEEVINTIGSKIPTFNKNLWSEKTREWLKKRGIDINDIQHWDYKNSVYNRYHRTHNMLEESHARDHALKFVHNNPNIDDIRWIDGYRARRDARNKAETITRNRANKEKILKRNNHRILTGYEIADRFNKNIKRYGNVFKNGVPQNYLKTPKELNSYTTLRMLRDVHKDVHSASKIQTYKGRIVNRAVARLSQYAKPSVLARHTDEKYKQGFNEIAEYINTHPEEFKHMIFNGRVSPEQLKKIEMAPIHAPSIPGSSEKLLEQVRNNAGYNPKTNTVAFDTITENPYILGHEFGHYFSRQVGNTSFMRYLKDAIPEEYFASLEGRNILKMVADKLNLKLPYTRTHTFQGLHSYVLGDSAFKNKLNILPDNVTTQMYKHGPQVLNNLLPKNELNAYLHSRFEQTGNAPDYIGHYIKNPIQQPQIGLDKAIKVKIKKKIKKPKKVKIPEADNS